MSDQQWQAYAAAVRRRALARVQWTEAKRVLGNARAKALMRMARDPHEVSRAQCVFNAATLELAEAQIAVTQAEREAGDTLIHVGGVAP